MSNQWHYSQDGAQYGPVDETEIVRLIQDGELAPGTPVCKEGGMDWGPARNHACFQVEIFPKKMRPSVQAAASTTSTPASGRTSQSPRQTLAQPAATPVSPVVTTVVVKEKSALPWVLFGGACVALVGVVVWIFFSAGPQPVTNRPPATTGATIPQPLATDPQAVNIQSAVVEKEERLIGEWKGTDTTGETGAFIFNKDGSAKMIQGNQVFDDSTIGGKLTWSLDASKDPMHLDLIVTMGGSSVTMRMIARFIGKDKLQFRMDEDKVTRPVNFSISEDKNQMMLERQ